MAKEKSRNFTFLMYPDGEGFPDDWEIRLEKIGVPIAISPLHDKDKAKADRVHHCVIEKVLIDYA